MSNRRKTKAQRLLQTARNHKKPLKKERAKNELVDLRARTENEVLDRILEDKENT